MLFLSTNLCAYCLPTVSILLCVVGPFDQTFNYLREASPSLSESSLSMADGPSPEKAAIPSPVSLPVPVSPSAEDPVDAEHQTDSPDGLSTSSKANAGDDDDGSDSGSVAWGGKRRENLVADWKFLDFHHFKNRYGPDEGLEIIEVLKGHPHLEQEIWREAQDRLPQGKSTRIDRRWKQKQKSYSKDIETEYIQRIRIQSPALILLLSHLSGSHDSWATNKPRVFFRPFRTQYYYQPQMKEILAILEKRFGNSQTDIATADAKVAPTEDIDETPGQEDDSKSDAFSFGSEEPEEIDWEDIISGDVANTATALQHVRKYVEFVDQHILPLWDRAQGTTKRKVAFLDLWMSFKLGEILYRPPNTDSPKGRDKSSQQVNKAHQSAWRFYSIVMESYADDKPDDFKAKKGRELSIYCYYIDYDGISYLPVQKKFTIKDYDGEKDITELPIYPLRFAKDTKKLMETFRKQGERFQFVKTEKYLFYDGWTLTQGPTGSSDESKELTSEHIDSNVVLDFLEGYKAEPSLGQPSFDGLQSFGDSDWPEGEDELEIRHWTNVLRVSGQVDVEEVTQRNEWFGRYLFTRHRNDNQFMRDWKSGYATELHGEDLALLPRRAIAFAFRERKFILADIYSLREVRKQEDVFQDLKIDPKHKQMIESLVKTHFQKQAMQKEFGVVNLNQDLILGKGAGLFLLLHGVPGVGKTATAEAIAQINSKPLFTITCGDLGFEPGKVDESLRNIFRLAHLWDCVLLLDEADVFLSRREVYDLKRNALVSGKHLQLDRDW